MSWAGEIITNGERTEQMIENLPQTIVISGIDGSGKSTQLDLIAQHLKEKKIKFKLIWLRWSAFFSYPFLVLCRLLGYTKWKKIPRSGAKYAERNFYKNPVIAKVWTWLFTIDTLIYTILRIKIPSWREYHVLCDRHVLDIIVDLMRETRNDALLETLPGKLLLSLMSETTILVLDVDEPEAYGRKKDIPSIDYLRKRRGIYLKLAKTLDFPVVDGGAQPREVHQKIMDKLRNNE